MYSKQPSGQYNNWPVQFSPQRNIVNTQIISVPVSCLSIFKFHRHSLDSPIYKNFTIFAVPKKKKKKNIKSVTYIWPPKLAYPLAINLYIIYHNRYQKINSTGTNNPRPFSRIKDLEFPESWPIDVNVQKKKRTFYYIPHRGDTNGLDNERAIRFKAALIAKRTTTRYKDGG